MNFIMETHLFCVLVDLLDHWTCGSHGLRINAHARPGIQGTIAPNLSNEKVCMKMGRESDEC